MAQKVRVVRFKTAESVENLLTLAPTPGLKHRIPQLQPLSPNFPTMTPGFNTFINITLMVWFQMQM